MEKEKQAQGKKLMKKFQKLKDYEKQHTRLLKELESVEKQKIRLKKEKSFALKRLKTHYSAQLLRNFIKSKIREQEEAHDTKQNQTMSTSSEGANL